MREGAVCHEIMDIAERATAANGLEEIVEIAVTVGAYSCVNARQLNFYFDAAKPGTRMARAVIRVERDVSAMLRELHDYTGRSSSACPSPGEWLAAFGDAEQVFGVALTSAISGSYNAARVAAEDYMSQHPGRKVFILDLLSTGPEMELIVEKYQELIASGLSFDAVEGRGK